ncbi:hypothetical protein ATK86_1578 [Nocardia fluminea]|uniref:Uncharacterized protein n=1 Tax=Nocardia fluminea TaxID=134984 RepID=A0A2N3V6L0_9NOCA|nr:hypothetical protein ATK86_1578 [Nocardia fluminea]
MKRRRVRLPPLVDAYPTAPLKHHCLRQRPVADADPTAPAKHHHLRLAPTVDAHPRTPAKHHHVRLTPTVDAHPTAPAKHHHLQLTPTVDAYPTTPLNHHRLRLAPVADADPSALLKHHHVRRASLADAVPTVRLKRHRFRLLPTVYADPSLRASPPRAACHVGAAPSESLSRWACASSACRVGTPRPTAATVDHILGRTRVFAVSHGTWECGVVVQSRCVGLDYFVGSTCGGTGFKPCARPGGAGYVIASTRGVFGSDHVVTRSRSRASRAGPMPSTSPS